MRLAIGLATATLGHALLLLGLGWVAPPPRSADLPDETVQVDVAVLDPARVGSLRPAVSGADSSTSADPPLLSKQSGRRQRSGRLDNPAGPAMPVAPITVQAAAVVAEGPAPVLLSVVVGGGESSAKTAQPGSASAPGSISSGGRGPGAPASAAGVRYRSHPLPPYPIGSLRRREEGVVLLSVDIGPDGRATQVSLNQGSGSPSLDSAAIEAVYSWTFEPARSAGAAVASRAVIPVRFSLAGR